MKIPDIRYRSSQIFGDTNWHRVLDLSQMDLSESNPVAFLVGQTELPRNVSSATKIKSVWLWRYNFLYANSGNYYGSSTGSNGTIAPSNWGVNIITNNTYNVGTGLPVEEAYATSGSNGKAVTSLSTIRFYSSDDTVFSPSVTYPSNRSNRGIVCRFLAEYEADLPDDMYTISGRNVTWNENNPIYTLLLGKEVFPY